ncbi:MAG: hypothetical protein ACI865_002517 [Flavobacteriaceae bacterium]|jgi:hypothetical protein
MKRHLLSFMALSMTFGASAQMTPLSLPAAAKMAAPSAKIGITGMETAGVFATKPQPYAAQMKAVNEEIIGVTVYDLQSNSSVQNRNVVHADGTISAAFTFGEVDPAFTDRGTGYNYYSASAWDVNPTARIETTRNGWPSLDLTAGGTEVVVSHSGSGAFTLNTRNPKGTGAWTESLIPTSTGAWMLWPRAATGGAAGNSIHCIGITAPVGNGGAEYMGVDGALLYWRSTDEGATWDIVDYLDPSLDSSKYIGTRADAYSIISEGDNVAIAMFYQWGDMVLLKSADNGTTWTTTIVNDFPIDLYVADQSGGSDWDGDLIADTIRTCDEAGAIAFDAAGMVHMTFGHMEVLDADTTDGNTSFFPGTQELYYWNETMAAGTFTTIAVPEDPNLDGILDFAGSFPLYFTSLCSFSTLAVSGAGTIYVTYAGYMENYFLTDQNHRHIYVLKSTDGGVTWSVPLDVTPDTNFDYYECVFPDIAAIVDDKVRICYMRDFEPGLAVRGDMDPYDDNQIMYLDVDTALVSDAGLNELYDFEVELILFPNPSDDVTSLEITIEKVQNVAITMTDLSGKKMPFSFEGTLIEGTHIMDVNTAELSVGTYYLTVEIDGRTKTSKLAVAR